VGAVLAAAITDGIMIGSARGVATRCELGESAAAIVVRAGREKRPRRKMDIMANTKPMADAWARRSAAVGNAIDKGAIRTMAITKIKFRRAAGIYSQAIASNNTAAEAPNTISQRGAMMSSIVATGRRPVKRY
jgi:hypothetical protein